MNLFQEMEVNYKDFIDSANDFMNSCREYTNNNEDEKIFLQLGEIAEKKRWKDKIKAKLEEVHYKMVAHPDVRMAVKEVLNSLLEKE